MTRTFVYKGKSKALLVRGHRLEKGKPFLTDDKRLAERLTMIVSVEEVTKTEPKAESKSSRRSDGEQS